MLARVITLRFDPLIGGFDDAPLRDFLKDKEVHAIREHFFIAHEAPYIAIVVTYQLRQPAVPMRSATERGSNDTSWRNLLSDENLPLFNALRDWRLERSQQEGVPPYIIGTNRQLAQIVSARPRSLSQLGHIDRFGQRKIEKYGKAILAIVAGSPGATPRNGALAPADETAHDDPQS